MREKGEPGNSGEATEGLPDEGLKVLIVDDSAEVRARTALLLLCEGADVLAPAADGMQAVEQARQFAPDLVVLDIRMPRMSGLEVLPQIKQLEPAPIVAMMTNHDNSVYRSRCAELGADHFLHKATEFERLREIVADLLDARQSNAA